MRKFVGLLGHCSDGLVSMDRPVKLKKVKRSLYIVGFLSAYINGICLYIPSLNFLSALSSGFVLMSICAWGLKSVIDLLDAPVWRFALFCTVLVLSMVSYLNSGQTYLLLGSLAIMALDGISVRRMLKLWLVCTLAVFATMLLASLAIVCFGDASELYTYRRDGTFRLSLLFSHPNILAAYSSMAIIVYLLTREGISAANELLAIVLATVMFLATDSKTSLIVVFAFLLLFHLFQRKEKSTYLIIRLLPLVLLAFVVVITEQGEDFKLYGLFQSLLTGRPGYWSLQFKSIGFTAFGQQALTGTVFLNNWYYEHVTIDSFFASALLQLGVWSAIAFIVLYERDISLLKNTVTTSSDKAALLAALAVLALFGLVETHMASIGICPLLLLLGNPMPDKNVLVDEEARFDLCAQVSVRNTERSGELNA